MPQAPESFGAPFKGAGRTGHPCVYTQNAQFFLSIFAGPQRGQDLCSSDFVATSIFPPPWGQMGTNVVCCLLKTPPSKLSQAAVGVFGPSPPPPPKQSDTEALYQPPTPPPAHPLKGAKMFRGCRGQGLHLGAPHGPMIVEE